MDSKTQEYLFENKEKIPEHIYINLMNNLKIDMIKKQEKYVKVHYIHIQGTSYISTDEDTSCLESSPILSTIKGSKIMKVVNNHEEDDEPTEYEITKKTKIYKTTFHRMKECIENYGYWEDGSPYVFEKENKYFVIKIEDC